MVSELHGRSCCITRKAVMVLSVVRYLLVILRTCTFQSCMVGDRAQLLHDKLALLGTMQQSRPHCTQESRVVHIRFEKLREALKCRNP